MSTRRGRPPLPPERRRHVRVSVSVTADVSDALFILARQKREPLSAILSKLLEQMVERNRQFAAHQIHGLDKTA